jgi:2-keto-4-pentenoate hydratase
MPDFSFRDRLLAATRDLTPIGEQAWPAIPDLRTADAIHVSIAAGLGYDIAGWKVAATNEAAQRKRGIVEPLYGRLYKHCLIGASDTCPRASFIDPAIELEFAFRFGSSPPVVDRRLDAEEIARCIAEVLPSIEIVDSRHTGWRNCPAPSLLVDNLAHGAAVIGEPVRDWIGRSLADLETRLLIDGAVVAIGSGAEVLGDPFEALAWLIETLHRHGQRIEPGQVVISGTTTAVVPLGAGTTVRAEFDHRIVLETRFES